VEAELTVLVLDVDAVQSENVKVDVEPERAVRALRHCDEARQSIVHAGKSERSLGAVPERAAELLGERARRLAAQVLVVAKHGAHSPGEGAHPVAGGDLGQDLLL
jgi:hypothetical protein